MKIVIEQINKTLDEKKIVKNFSFVIDDGGIYALSGKSGSGKTTFLNMILGLEKPDSGKIKYEAHAISDYRADSDTASKQLNSFILCENARAYTFGMVFQQDRLLENKNAIQNILFTSSVDKTIEEIKTELEKLLKGVDLYKNVSELSGGERRRVSILRALFSNDSGIIIMDEPFSGLDAATKETVRTYIKQNLKGRTFVFSTHDASDISYFNAEVIKIGENS